SGSDDMLPDTFKRLALRFLPDRVLQKLKKIHYAKALRAASELGEPDLKVVRHLVGPGSHVIDVGANFGVYTKFLAELVQPSGRPALPCARWRCKHALLIRCSGSCARSIS